LTIRDEFTATVEDMDEAAAVLERLERLERLQREEAAPEALLEELRLLLHEAEEWARAEGGAEGEDAVGKMRSALARDYAVA
jgi:hypothetical protein